MRFGSRGPSEVLSQIRHRNALTEKAWEDAVQGLGKVVTKYKSQITRRKYIS